MAIPKKYKKDLIKNVRNLDKQSNVGKKKLTWQFKKGDLVMTKKGVWGVVVESASSGYFYIMSSDGRLKVHAKELNRVQSNKVKN